MDVETFYRAWFERCYAMARAATRRDESFCLDVVQDVFLRLIRRDVRLPDEAGAEAWLRRCVLRCAIDRIRREHRRRAREHAVARSSPGGRGPPADPEELRRLRRLLAELPPDDRGLLVLRFVRGRTAPQIGGLLGATPDAVSGRLRRTLHRLRARLATEDRRETPDAS